MHHGHLLSLRESNMVLWEVQEGQAQKFSARVECTVIKMDTK